MDKKILYLTQTYPFPANDGGEQALQRHVFELEDSKYANNIKMFFSLFNKTAYDIKTLSIDNRIFEIRKYKNRFVKILTEAFEFFFSKYSRSYHLIDTKELRKAIKEYNPDIVIMDHIGCYKTLKRIKYQGTLIYIAHNIETNFNFDIARLQKNIIKKFIRYVCGIKTYFTENSVMRRSDKIGCISASDYKIINSKFPDKTVLCSLTPELFDREWEIPGSKILFFCGPADFYPNKDAINWIINDLAPKMPDIQFKIAGKDTEKISVTSDNVECLGFVTKEELINLYITSSAFLCPIIYGSGIKMKIVEALGYYSPIIATKEALEGLENIDIPSLIDRNNIEQTIVNITKLLENKDILLSFQKKIKDCVQYARNNNTKLDDIIEAIINK